MPQETNNKQKSQDTGSTTAGSPLDRYTVQPRPDDSSQGPYYKSAAPQISLPKGGGALKGIDEKFQVNAVNGTAGLSIPLPLTPGRGGFTPALSLSYSSGAGNSAFGLGWDLGLPAIQRRTDKKLPRYNDAPFDSAHGSGEDVFVLSGAEDLVPVIDGAPNPFTLTDTVDGETVSYTIKRYRPRIEGLFARIEYIKKAGTADSWWRVTTKDNITTYYGLTAEGRITDPGYAYRIFKWLPQLALDHKGNVQWYRYIAEDLRGVADSVFEKNRLNGLAPFANTYLKRVQYGNKEPFFISGTGAAAIYEPVLPSSLTYLVESVLDYGDHSTPYSPIPDRDWQSRSDAFSDFHAGFEIRTYRRCQRVLQFHHFTELLGNDLVRSLELTYQNGAYDAGSPPAEADFIVSATQSGYQYTAGGWRSKALPPMQFSYQPLEWSNEIQVVGKDDFRGTPQGLTGPYQWIDFEGEGISGILTEQAGGWFYKNNLGDGHFDTPKTIAPKPSFTGLGGGGLQWQDLDADGRRQVVAQGPLKGYWELDDPSAGSGQAPEWQPFRAFDKNINIDWNSPFTKMLDLDGDGRADVLLTEDRAWTWYENLGTEGYGTGGNAPLFTDEEKGPLLLLRDEVQSIFLADMNGDGLTDLVRIRNGEVCYWPNKGYGRFGARVTMLNAPLFQRPELYNPLYLTLADISGTGAADLIYVGRNKCTAWLNCCGNVFTDGVDINPLPGTDVYSKIAVTDFLGNGTACIVWSSPLPHFATAPLQYIDLMAGHKPYLMTGYSNGTGKSVAMSYKSSTQFYLADKLAGIPWATRLPFPVHCVSAVTTTDSVSNTVYTQTYKYRHGYYDHEEREYRGFGYVETLDTDVAAVSDAEALDQPPVLTKTWYHTGAWMREGTLLDKFKEEYFPVEGWDDAVTIATFPPGLNAQELREAHRALKGSPLRQEVYAPDGTEKAGVPYSVTATAYEIKKIQPLGSNRYASFLNLQQQSIVFAGERTSDPATPGVLKLYDPRVMHSLTLQTDEYGHVLQSAQVAYPRLNGESTLPPKVQGEQAKMHITGAQNTYTNDSIDTTHYQYYRLRLPYEAKSYEVNLEAPAQNALWQPDELKTAIDAAAVVDFSETAQIGEKRLLGHSLSLFYSNDAATVLGPGILESLALPYEHYTLAFTPGILTQNYETRVTTAMLEEGGYLDIQSDGNYWLPSGRAVYSSPQTKFYTPETFSDPWGNETTVSYWGAYWLLPETITDAKGNMSSVTAYDWRILQPLGMKDANDNISEILYDALGMPVAMALKGKGDGTEGDTLAGLDPDSAADLANQAAFWADPDSAASDLLQGATWRCVYDLDTLPVAVGMIAREEHNADMPESPMLLRFSYSDGMGRVLMHKVPCEPHSSLSGVEGWIGSGRSIYNNKGKAVMQYEPYFSLTPTCDTAEQAAAEGVSPKLFYDPLGRDYRTELPDGSYTKTEWTAWEQTVWDNNDTVLDSAWYAARIGGAMGPEEQDAAEKAAAHAGTPTVMHLDSLARPFYTIQQDTQSTYISSYEILDIQSNRLSVVDGRGQQILQYRYTPLQAPGYHNSKDSGLWRSFTDVSGQALYSWDPGARQFHTIYDVLRRPVQQEVLQNAVTRVLEQFIYGEGQPDDKQNNLRGALFQHKDGAGLVQADRYDFKGNLLISERTYTEDATQHPNWGGTVAMETDTYTTVGTFDALNRPVTVTTPEGGITEDAYDKGGLLKTVRVDNVHSLDTGIVNNIEYDAKGQRQKIQYKNGATTTYAYDAFTFRVRNIKTIRSTDSKVLQDLQYWYDPVGNITLQKDGAQQPVYFDGSVATPENDYTYDALYRLTEMSGRELAGNNNAPTYNDNGRVGITPVPIVATDTAKMRRYTEAYTYDKAGNMLTQQHTVTGGTGNWTRTYTIAGGNNRLTGCSIGSNNPVAETYTHDGRGNMITGFNHLQSLAYNDANRLQRVIIDGNRTVYYQYDGTGQRVRKTVVNSSAHTTESRKYIGNFELYRNFDTSSLNINLERETLNIHDDTGRIALIDTRTAGTGTEPAQLLRYQYSNHLGTAALELDTAGAVISYEEYYPYGGTSFQSGRSAAEVSLKRYRYTGKERDEETGLYYHGARYYVPWLCRWAASDPLEDQYAALSSYHYGFDNPIKWQDSTGMGPDDPPKKPKAKPKQVKGEKPATNTAKPVTLFSPMTKVTTAADNLRVFRLNDPPKQQYFFSDKEYYAYKATKAEPTILAADMYGTGHIGPASQVKSIIASIKQEYVNAVYQNIKNGPFGAFGYLVGGEQGSFPGATLDMTMAAAVAMRSTEPVNPVQQRFVAKTETPKRTVGTGTQLKLSMEQAAEVNPAFATKTGSTTLYRAVSKAELDDIAINGIRNSPGYETGKLFATSTQDAANFGRLNFGLDKKPFTIIKTSIPNKYSPMLYRGEMDLMQGVSVPSNLFNQLSKPSIFNKTPLPNHPWIK